MQFRTHQHVRRHGYSRIKCMSVEVRCRCLQSSPVPACHQPYAFALQPAIDSNDDDDEQQTAYTATTSTAPYPAAAAVDEPADCCEVCLEAPREAIALVPRRHARFCESCANTVSAIDTVPCAVQTSACSCVSSCRLNTDTCSDRTACWRYTSATSSSFFV